MSRILFCEDDPAIHKLIRMALRNSPHEVLMAHDGAEGLAMVKAHRPAIVFSGPTSRKRSAAGRYE
jgi:CheY-like chemotaxis protein